MRVKTVLRRALGLPVPPPTREERAEQLTREAAERQAAKDRAADAKAAADRRREAEEARREAAVRQHAADAIREHVETFGHWFPGDRSVRNLRGRSSFAERVREVLAAFRRGY